MSHHFVAQDALRTAMVAYTAAHNARAKTDVDERFAVGNTVFVWRGCVSVVMVTPASYVRHRRIPVSFRTRRNAAFSGRLGVQQVLASALHEQPAPKH